MPDLQIASPIDALFQSTTVDGFKNGLNIRYLVVTGPDADRTFTFPNSDATVLTSAAAVTGAQGGTGVANTGKTITLGGNLTTSGAHNLTLTLSNATSVTLPTTGTLATLDGTETFTGKTIAYGSNTIQNLPEPFVFLLSGPLVTDAATTGRKAWFRVVKAFTLAAADVSLDSVTAPTGSTFIGDIEKNGSSIYSARPSIAAGENTSTSGSGVVGTMSSNPTSFAAGDLVGVWVDQIGASTAGAGCSMTWQIKN